MYSALTSLRTLNVFSQLRAFTPFQTDLLKTLALAAMLADHVNAILLHYSSSLLYLTGRMAFPLFTLVWAANLPDSAQKMQRQAVRLWIWAFITQPVFWLAFMSSGQSWLVLNILFLFAGCTQLLAWQARYGTNGMMAGIALLLLLAWPLTPSGCGLNSMLFALMCVAGFRVALLSGSLLFMVVLLIALAAQQTYSSPTFPDNLTVTDTGMIALLLLPVAIGVVAVFPRKLFRRVWPRCFFYHADAGHLLLLGVLALHQ
ncbi:MAG: TraX family protein [Enterobacterales bacterium endosymbiont of Blomia tropicalis]|uniref:TraX family protein n=1 Tax=Mixta mediterraneensis TaxID=2758443 RepID=UPI0025A80E4A|nr:TraX family protein [Mixta mediterraneensis]MDL4915875.1 TraX family protein [Mixta mediterraneensis]